MKYIYELIRTAARLRAVTEVNSISPEDTFGLLEDALEYLADMEQNADGLSIRKVYSNYAAMVADASAPVGSNGKPLRFGQLVIIYDPGNISQQEHGNVYSWRKGNAGEAAWQLIGNLGSVYDLQRQVTEVAAMVLSASDVNRLVSGQTSDYIARETPMCKVSSLRSVDFESSSLLIRAANNVIDRLHYGLNAGPDGDTVDTYKIYTNNGSVAEDDVTEGVITRGIPVGLCCVSYDGCCLYFLNNSISIANDEWSQIVWNGYVDPVTKLIQPGDHICIRSHGGSGWSDWDMFNQDQVRSSIEALSQQLNTEGNRAAGAEQVLDQKISAEETRAKDAELQNATRIGAIEALVPMQASANNELADKLFVNSSVATHTANYISNNRQPFMSLANLEAYSGALTNNDFAFVVGVDAAGNTIYTRYKYNASTQQWAEEYVLNNSSFTAEQWATINSAITSGDVTKLRALPTKVQLDALFAQKQDSLVSGTNIKTINNKSILGGGNLDVKDLFLVLYGVTQFSAIVEAYIGGKFIYSMNPNGKVYLLANITNDGATFWNVDDDGLTFSMFKVNSNNTYSEIVHTSVQTKLTFDSTPTENSNNPVKSSGIKSSLDELLMRMQGLSDNYDGGDDPVLRKIFPQGEVPQGIHVFSYALKQANDYLNEQYFAMQDSMYYHGQENGEPKEVAYQDIKTISRNLIHIDVTGGCMWVMNMPYSFATGSFRQIAFGANNYANTETGVEVTNGIWPGVKILQRTSTYNFDTGEVEWSNWEEVVPDLATIRSLASGALQRSGGKMTGDLNLNGYGLQVQANRNGIRFSGDNVVGVLVGNGNMNLTFQTGNADLKHRKGTVDYVILDTSNTKTINGSSLFGSGNLTLQVAKSHVLIDNASGATNNTNCTVALFNVYSFSTALETYTINLPQLTSAAVGEITLYVETGTTPVVTFNAANGESIYIQKGLSFNAGSTYEIKITCANQKWRISAVELEE